MLYYIAKLPLKIVCTLTSLKVLRGVQCNYHWTSVSIQEQINEECTSFWAVGCKWVLWAEERFILEANTVIKKKLFLIKSTCKFALGGIFIKPVFQQINSNISTQPQSKQVLGEKAALPALQQNANMTGTARTLARQHNCLTSSVPPVTRQWWSISC